MLLSQPMRIKTKTNHDLRMLARIFPLFAPVTLFVKDFDWLIVLFSSAVTGQSTAHFGFSLYDTQ